MCPHSSQKRDDNKTQNFFGEGGGLGLNWKCDFPLGNAKDIINFLSPGNKTSSEAGLHNDMNSEDAIVFY